MTDRSAQITVFSKRTGPLTKHLELINGKVANDSSGCRMARGSARRVAIDLNNLTTFADQINAFSFKEAYALGRLRGGLPERVKIVRADKVSEAHDPLTIARSKQNLIFVAGEPGLVLLDIDLKGISESAESRIKEMGGVWASLCELCPALNSAAYVERASTSSGLRNRETGETYPGSGGFHAAVAVADGSDVPRFLADLHDRLWLAGLGWGMVSAAGSFLERALIDRAVGSPERLIFEGPPTIEPPLEQAPRPAVAHEGVVLDTLAACPPLTDAEKEEVKRLKEAERARLKPDADQARTQWSADHVKCLTASGMSETAARAEVDRWIDNKELTGDFELPFDDPKLAGATVDDVLAAPGKYVGKTLADPHEGVVYGKGKAICYRRRDGSLFVNSFAHGGCKYELRAAPTPDADAEIDRLARLPALDYDRAREAAAKRLAIRVSALDTAVQDKRRKLNPPDDTAPAGLEDGVALRFAAVHEDDYRYVAQRGQWMHWRGTRWQAEHTLKAFDAARVLCRAGGDADAKVVAAVERLARSDRRLAADADMWDAEPWALNTPDGVVDLRTGSMRPHRRADYCTKITAVSPRGDCPKFKAFLRRIMRDDDEMVGFLKRASGYCLTGDTSEQAIFFNYGVGSNGKTVLMATVSGILGDYCQATPIETFTETKTDRHPTELARLRGARLVTATETEAGRYWAESRIKEITGGERIAARFMHADFFEYSPEFKPWITGNHRPRLRSVGKAMRRRIKMISFAFIIPDAERDRDFAIKLKDEWPGILKWMIEGCLEWQKNGLAPPDAVEQATDAYFAAEDGYADWIADRCETSRGYETRSTKLFGSWRDWAEKAGQRIGDNKQFREEMERLGHPLKHTKTGNYYLGLRIREDPPEPDEPNRSAPELDLAPPEPARPAGATPAAATRVKAGEGSSDFARHARARERYFMEKPSPAFTAPETAPGVGGGIPGRRCAQCGKPADGREEFCAFPDEEVWLHPECQRAYVNKGQAASVVADPESGPPR